MGDELHENEGPLTAEEILRFGPVVEAQVWTPVFLQEKRAPIAVAAGKPKLGPIFNSDGVGRAALIRPCVSRGKRIRGLPPIYAPAMLEANAGVFTGWPMYLDHVPAALAETVAKRGRSVRELGGQVLTPYFDREFVQEYDGDFGYQPGGTLAEIWATPYLRNLVGENPNLLHTSIAAWPTSGKPGTAPWNTALKGMNIEGIRRQPQGSVDFVPRGGAGGRLLLAEGEDVGPDERAWPEPEWTEEATTFAVAIAERTFEVAPEVSPADPSYASREMGREDTPNFREMQAPELRVWMQEHAPHLMPALAESVAVTPPPAAAAGLTEEDVRRIVQDSRSDQPVPLTEEQIEERVSQLAGERDEQRELAREAERMIESAEGIPPAWKADLRARYAMLPSGPQPALIVEEGVDDDGNAQSKLDVLRENVTADLDHCRSLIAEAVGKPRVTGEGGATPKSTGSEGRSGAKPKTPYWREQFADMGIVESADKALAIHGVEKVEG